MPDETERRLMQLETLIVGLYDIVATTHQASDEAIAAYHAISERIQHRGIENPFFLTPEGQKREEKLKIERLKAEREAVKDVEPKKEKKAVKNEKTEES